MTVAEANASAITLEGFSGTPYVKQSQVWLPRSPEQIFPFFADACNLEKLTPSWLNFEVQTPRPIEMKVGALIDYKLRVRFLPLRWRTRIAVWDPPHRFVDEQLRGPYRLWVHEHRFEAKDGGTLCADTVQYAVPGGALVHALFVKRNVEAIFNYREQKLKEMFSD